MPNLRRLLPFLALVAGCALLPPAVAGNVSSALSATKTVTGLFQPGTAVTYTIVLSNAGPGTQNDNPGNELTDVLPAQLTLISAAATSGVVGVSVGGNTVIWNGAIAAGGSVTITINATVGNSVAGGTTISNQATFSFDADGNGTNESSGVTDDPAVVGNANPTTFQVQALAPSAPPLPIPTLGTATMVLLALLLVAALGMRRKS